MARIGARGSADHGSMPRMAIAAPTSGDLEALETITLTDTGWGDFQELGLSSSQNSLMAWALNPAGDRRLHTCRKRHLLSSVALSLFPYYRPQGILAIGVHRS
jgi:hypothetical protein